MKRFAITATVALVAVAFAIAGCGGSAATTAPAAVNGSTQSAAPAASAAASASTGRQAAGATAQAGAGSPGSVNDGIGHPVSICDLLPVATVEDDTANYKLYSCSYTSADGTSGVDVSVLALDAATGFDSAQQADSNAKVINGLGDKAFSSILGVCALFGNVQITVSDVQSDDAAITLIKTLQPKL